MTKKTLLYLLLGVVTISLLLVFLIGESTEEVPQNDNPERFYSTSRWDNKMTFSNKGPYGLYVFEQLAISSGRFDAFNLIYDYQLMDSIQKLDNQLFMFVGDRFELTNNEIRSLINSVKKGNELFVSANDFSVSFLSAFSPEITLSYFAEDSVDFKTYDNKKYSMLYIYEKDTLSTLWSVFNQTPNLIGKSYIKNVPNLVEIKLGEGRIYLHSNTFAFQNYQLLRRPGKEYFKFFINQFSNSQIQWLSFAEYEPPIAEYEYEENQGNETSLLVRIFEFRSLRWAVFIIVIGIILFFLFRSKRMQPVIPILNDNNNAGLSYLDTITGIYFSQKKPEQIRKLMLRNFCTTVQQHFFIDINKRNSSDPLNILAQKSKTELAFIINLVKRLEETSSIKNSELMRLRKDLRAFYISSGIWIDLSLDKTNKMQSFFRPILAGILYIFFGLFSLVLAFILLAYSIGIGVLFWPIALLLIYIGSKMLNQPLISLSSNQVTIYSLFLPKKVINKKEITSIEINDQKILIKQKSNDISIRLSDIQQKSVSHLITLIHSYNP